MVKNKHRNLEPILLLCNIGKDLDRFNSNISEPEGENHPSKVDFIVFLPQVMKYNIYPKVVAHLSSL